MEVIVSKNAEVSTTYMATTPPRDATEVTEPSLGSSVLRISTTTSQIEVAGESLSVACSPSDRARHEDMLMQVLLSSCDKT